MTRGAATSSGCRLPASSRCALRRSASAASRWPAGQSCRRLARSACTSGCRHVPMPGSPVCARVARRCSCSAARLAEPLQSPLGRSPSTHLVEGRDLMKWAFAGRNRRAEVFRPVGARGCPARPSAGSLLRGTHLVRIADREFVVNPASACGCNRRRPVVATGGRCRDRSASQATSSSPQRLRSPSRAT